MAHLADPEVVEIREQVEVWYAGGDGVKRRRFLDFVIRFRSGLVRAVSVKDRKGVKAHVDELREVALGVLDFECDEWVVLSDADVSREEETDAWLIRECLKDHDGSAIRAVRRALPSLPARIPLSGVADATGLGSRGRRAAIALVAFGDLALENGEHLQGDPWLVNRNAS